MRLVPAWATTSPKCSCSIRGPTRPGPRPISIGPRHIRDLSTSSVPGATARKRRTLDQRDDTEGDDDEQVSLLLDQRSWCGGGGEARLARVTLSGRHRDHPHRDGRPPGDPG